MNRKCRKKVILWAAALLAFATIAHPRAAGAGTAPTLWRKLDLSWIELHKESNFPLALAALSLVCCFYFMPHSSQQITFAAWSKRNICQSHWSPTHKKKKKKKYNAKKFCVVVGAYISSQCKGVSLLFLCHQVNAGPRKVLVGAWLLPICESEIRFVPIPETRCSLVSAIWLVVVGLLTVGAPVVPKPFRFGKGVQLLWGRAKLVVADALHRLSFLHALQKYNNYQSMNDNNSLRGNLCNKPNFFAQ